MIPQPNGPGGDRQAGYQTQSRLVCLDTRRKDVPSGPQHACYQAHQALPWLSLARSLPPNVLAASAARLGANTAPLLHVLASIQGVLQTEETPMS